MFSWLPTFMSSSTSILWLRPGKLGLVSLLWIYFMLLNASASSPPSRSLKQISRPVIRTLEVLPRSSAQQSHGFSSRSLLSDSSLLQHTDSFRLVLKAFGETHYLHLRPNLDLLHNSARIKYFKNGPNGVSVLDRIEPLLPHTIKAYLGEVIHPNASDTRLFEDHLGGLLHSQAEILGWARIIVHSQGDATTGTEAIIEGAYTVNGVTHHIMPQDKYLRVKHPMDPHILFESKSRLVVFRDSDLRQEYRNESSLTSLSTSTCLHDHLKWNTNSWVNPSLRQFHPPSTGFRADFDYRRHKRDDVVGSPIDNNFETSIGQSAGCPIDQRIVYMGVAADCQYVQQHGSQQNATMAILNNWNTATALYKKTFNISLGILEVEIHEPTCPAKADPSAQWNVDCGNLSLNDRLSLFSQWRGNKSEDGAGLWHLMSGCPTGTEVGVAWLGTLCMTTASDQVSDGVVSGTGVSTAGRAEWQVIAHEIGHNFGAIHDCVSDCDGSKTCCPLSTSQCDSKSAFIMSPTSSSTEEIFSQCSLGNICSLMLSKTTNTTCIQPPDPTKQTLSLQMCGNGIVEPGEECDPGSGITSPCCDSSTCKLRSGAVCDPASATCCTETCQYAPSTQVCRPAKDVACDMPEMCTGSSANCPADKTQPDGQSCGKNGLACASGQCTSLAVQCQTVGGTMGLTAACPTKGDTSCQLACQNPQQNQQCLVLQAQLIDGSPCGYGGKCSQGHCKSGSILDTFEAWYRSNLQIAIPATIGVAAVLLLIIISIIRCLCRYRKRGRSTSSEPALNSARGQRLASWMGVSSPSRTQPMVETLQPTEREWIPPPRVLSQSDRRSKPIRSSRRESTMSDGEDVTRPFTGRRNFSRSTRVRSTDDRILPSRSDERSDALRAGSAAWRRNHSEGQSNTGRGEGGGSRYDRFRPSRSSYGASPSYGSDWVDATAWNGPVRR